MGLCSVIHRLEQAMEKRRIELGYKHHAALAQLHRWYQFYENPAVGLKNQLDILASNVSVKSSNGEAKGHEEYRERVMKLPSTWKNAHFVRSTDFKIADEGSIHLRAEITYVNLGILPDGSVRTAELSYDASLKPTQSLLPQFETIAITQKSEGKTEAFKMAYGENRLWSLVHYWLAILEDPSRNPEPVQEILTDSFVLNFSSGTIRDFDGFKSWLAGPGSQAKASTHAVSHFAYETTADNQYALSMDFDWEGILPDGKIMTAKTHHRWIVLDDPAERFARIKSIDVEVLKPFAAQ
jgi:hypothetical protein